MYDSLFHKLSIVSFLISQINDINAIIYLSSAYKQLHTAKLHLPHLVRRITSIATSLSPNSFATASKGLTVIIMSAAILNVTAIDTNTDIDILVNNKAYPVIYAARLVRGTILTFLLSILEDMNHIVKIYTPEVNDKDVQDHLISINKRSERYTLTYKGRCEVDISHKFYLEPDA